MPALPFFVCTGMGGMHLAHPCCRGDEAQEMPAWTGQCCRVALPARGDAQLGPPKPRGLPSPAAVPGDVSPQSVPCLFSMLVWPPAFRGGAPPGTHLPERRVLRI